MNRGRKRRVRVGLYPYWTPLPPSPGKAVYVGSENGLGIGEGVPWLIGGGECLHPHPPRGDGPGSKVSFSCVATGPHTPGRRCVTTPGAQPVAGGHQSEVSARGSWYLVWQGTIMHIIRLCPGPGGRSQGRHRPGELAVFRQVWRPAAWGAIEGPSAGLAPRRQPEQQRSDPE